MVVRHGDLVDRGQPRLGRTRVHANTYTVEAAIRMGFREVGKMSAPARGEVAIDDCRRKKDVLLFLAAATNRLFNDRAREWVRAIQAGTDEAPQALYHRRHFDTTPLYLKYGDLQDKVEPFGRQLVAVVDRFPESGAESLRWTTVSHSKFQELHGRRACPGGAWCTHYVPES